LLSIEAQFQTNYLVAERHASGLLRMFGNMAPPVGAHLFKTTSSGKIGAGERREIAAMRAQRGAMPL
jgi:hypothetical protein